MTPDNPFDGGRPRPIATVLDALRARIDAERFDARRRLAGGGGGGPRLRRRAAAARRGRLDRRTARRGKKVALCASGERARAALELAGVADLFDAIVTGPRNTGTLAEATAGARRRGRRRDPRRRRARRDPGRPRGGLRPPDRRRPQPRHARGPAPGRRRHGRRRPAGAARLRPRASTASDSTCRSVVDSSPIDGAGRGRTSPIDDDRHQEIIDAIRAIPEGFVAHLRRRLARRAAPLCPPPRDRAAPRRPPLVARRPRRRHAWRWGRSSANASGGGRPLQGRPGRPRRRPHPPRSLTGGPEERRTGVEPASLAWKAKALPLSYRRTQGGA